VQGAKALVEFASQQWPDVMKDEASPVGEAAKRVAKFDTIVTEIPQWLAADLRTLYAAPELQRALARRNEFQLEDCVLEFYPALVKSYPKWGGPNWVPAESDCVRARVRTTGVAEEHFVIDGVTFRLFDAGGQRSERRKWIHYFDKVNSVLFMTSLTGYCESLFEDSSQNSLTEALDLFDNISNSKWFRSTPIMLFLNKHDLFLDRFVTQGIPLNVSGQFPDAPESRDPDEAVDWFSKRFRSRKRSDGLDQLAEGLVYVHVTTAVSRDVVERVFYTCKTIILKDALKDSGFSS